MAKVTIQPGMLTGFGWEQLFQAGDPTDTAIYDPDNNTENNASTFTYHVEKNGVSFTVVLTSAGNNFTYGPNPFYTVDIPTGGTITKIQVVNDDASGTNALKIENLSFSMERFFKLAFDFDFNGNQRNGDGFNTISEILSGNDTFQFSFTPADGDYYNMTAGRNRGNDTLTGHNNLNNGNYFQGDKGADTYVGKAGHNDTLSYQDATDRDDAFRGISLDAKTGKATDCWGNIDTFSAIENFQGSNFADVMFGKNQASSGSAAYDEWFYGLNGADKIDGRGGTDVISYQNDKDVPGGFHGINANLFTLDAKGFAHVIDSFGKTDLVKNVEAVMATMFNDTIVGSNGFNWFQGLGGDDNINGKGGSDWIFFWKNGNELGGGAVSVNLGAGTASDGFGGTDTLTSIENVYASKFGDTLIGSGAANRLEGQQGDDILDGKGGNDTLRGDDNGGGADTFRFSVLASASNHDIVDDFVSGTDKVEVSKSVFGLTGSVGAATSGDFEAGAGAEPSGAQRLYFNTTTHNLFLDTNGSTAGGQTLIAHFNNSANVALGDVFLIA